MVAAGAGIVASAITGRPNVRRAVTVVNAVEANGHVRKIERA